MTTVAALAAALTVGAAVAANAACDAVFLTVFRAADLPWVMVSAAVCTLLFAMLASAAMRSLGPGRFAPLLFGGCTLSIASIPLLQQGSEHVAAVLLYLLVAAVVGALMPAAWGLLNERFDPTSGKRAFSTITWSSTVGSVLGGLTAERVAKYLGPDAVLFGVALAFGIAGVLIFVISRRWKAVGTPISASTDNPSLPYARRYLIALAALTLTMAVGGQVVDYLFKEAASATWEGEHLLRFFAVFYASAGLIGFLGQIVVTPRALARLGPARTSSFLPVTLGLTSIVASALAPLIGASLLKATSSISKTVFHRASYELFFVPIPKATKRTAKLMIDVGAASLGAMVGGAALGGLLEIGAGPGALYAVVAFLAVANLGAIAFITWGYVRSLADSVVAQADALALTQTLALGRATVRPLHGTEVDALESAPSQPQTSLAADFALLSSREDPEAILERLERPVASSLLPLLLDLLAWDAVSASVKPHLASMAADHIGALEDALLDPESPFAVRRRVAQVLIHGPVDRAVRALITGLEDERFEVRHHCAKALARLRARETEVPEAPIRAALLQECALSEAVRSARTLLDPAADDPDPFDERDRVRSLTHAFTLLACLYPLEPIQAAYAALKSSDSSARGTGTEYLSQILDTELLAALVPILPRMALAEAG